MDLLVAYSGDPAGYNMARHLSEGAEARRDVLRCDGFDLLVIDTPAVSADWLDDRYDYDGFVFLSRHAAASGTLALTCHTTGNFSAAESGGRDRQVAVPYPGLQKLYMQRLYERRSDYAGFQATIEATHHGPTGLDRPSMFVEIGTTPEQWNDERLCGSVADLLAGAVRDNSGTYPVAICLGGTHYPAKFTDMLVHGEYALGTVMPRHALGLLDEDLLAHIIRRNSGAGTALLDSRGLGPHRRRVLDLLSGTDLEVVKL